LATRWKRRYRSKQAEAPWYLLTNLDSLEKTLKLYESRFGIEAMFKDCKTGGYNIEKTKVSEPRFLALVLLIAIAYSLNTIRGQQLNILPHRVYICRLKESRLFVTLYAKSTDKMPRQHTSNRKIPKVSKAIASSFY